MALFYGLVSGLVAIGVVWLIRKMLRQSYIDSLKDMLVLVGMASGAAWLIGRGFETSELIASFRSIPWGLVWVVDSVLLAGLLCVIYSRKGKDA
ncbi:hypothetical protein [Comamonas sp. A7-5]|uniref:hypothetical protein n=1 Tax=Comamonas TaxID=283 RepID=UPI0031D4D6F0